MGVSFDLLSSLGDNTFEHLALNGLSVPDEDYLFPMLLHLSCLPQNWRPDPHVLGMDWFFLVFLPGVHQLFSLSVENSSAVTLPTLVLWWVRLVNGFFPLFLNEEYGFLWVLMYCCTLLSSSSKNLMVKIYFKQSNSKVWLILKWLGLLSCINEGNQNAI